MIWTAIRSVVFGVLTVAEAIADASSSLRRIGRALAPQKSEDAFPLSRRREKLIKDQIDRATSYRVEPIPPTQRSRTDKPR